MDDYILKVLSRQELREEASAEGVWEKGRYISREVPGNSENAEPEQGIYSAEAEEINREKTLWSVLRDMEPLTLRALEEKRETREAVSVGGYVSPALTRLSGVVFGQKSQQLTPEGLSMFYQRDARRFS